MFFSLSGVGEKWSEGEIISLFEMAELRDELVVMVIE
jgi:hypothetical protein